MSSPSSCIDEVIATYCRAYFYLMWVSKLMIPDNSPAIFLEGTNLWVSICIHMNENFIKWIMNLILWVELHNVNRLKNYLKNNWMNGLALTNVVGNMNQLMYKYICTYGFIWIIVSVHSSAFVLLTLPNYCNGDIFICLHILLCIAIVLITCFVLLSWLLSGEAWVEHRVLECLGQVDFWLVTPVCDFKNQEFLRCNHWLDS